MCIAMSVIEEEKKGNQNPIRTPTEHVHVIKGAENTTIQCVCEIGIGY